MIPQSFLILPTIFSYQRSIYSTLVIVVSPRAIIPARIIVTPARRSQLDTVVPLRWVRPNTIASWGFMMAIWPFIFSISMSQLSLPSKRTSWIRDIPSAWVRRSANGDWRSVGNHGNIAVWRLVGRRLLRELYTMIVSSSGVSNRTPASLHFPRNAVRSCTRAHSIRIDGSAVSAQSIMKVPLSI